MRWPTGTPASASTAELVVATTQVLDERVPRITTLAVRFVFSPRIGLSLAFSRPWSHSTRLFSYWPVLCNAAGTKSSITLAKAGARSVMTSAGIAVDGQGSGEERAGSGDVPTLRHVHVDHLAVLVDRPIHIAPDPGDLDVGLVDEPAIPGHVPTRPGRVDQQRREPLHPPIEGHVVDLDATLGEELFEVPVGQPVPEVPAHRQQDHLGRETETSETRRHPHRWSRTASALHRATLTATLRCVNATEPFRSRNAGRQSGRAGGEIPIADGARHFAQIDTARGARSAASPGCPCHRRSRRSGTKLLARQGRGRTIGFMAVGPRAASSPLEEPNPSGRLG